MSILNSKMFVTNHGVFFFENNNTSYTKNSGNFSLKKKAQQRKISFVL